MSMSLYAIASLVGSHDEVIVNDAYATAIVVEGRPSREIESDFSEAMKASLNHLEMTRAKGRQARQVCMYSILSRVNSS